MPSRLSNAPSSQSRRRFLSAGLCACCAVAAPRFMATAVAQAADRGAPTTLELGREGMTRIADTVWVGQIAPGVWMHSTTHPIGGFMYPANGLVLDRADGSVLIDTGWTPEQAGTLVQWARSALTSPVKAAIGTHYHDDRIGGVERLKAAQIPTYAHPLTCELARQIGVPVPEPLMGFTAASYRYDAGCELFFPGGGHTRDNIAVWLPEQRVLFGGCFLKSSTSTGLGNIADAVMNDWADSVRRLDRQYPGRAITVPGHGTVTGDAIGQTLALLAKKP